MTICINKPESPRLQSEPLRLNGNWPKETQLVGCRVGTQSTNLVNAGHIASGVINLQKYEPALSHFHGVP